MKETITIIHLDNNRADTEYVKQLLEKEFGKQRVKFFQTENFSEFTNILSKEKINLIITDLNLTGFSGIEVIKFVREAFPEIPIIVLTGTGNEELAVQSLHLGAKEYLTKKTKNFQKLPIIIEKVIETEKLRKENIEKEIYFKTLTEALPEAIIDVKLPDRIITFASKGIEKIFGYTPQEVIGQSTVIFFKNKEDYKKLGENLIKATLKRKKTTKFKTILKKKDGTMFFAEITSTFQYENGEVKKVIDIVRDITKEETYKKNLIAEKNKYASLFSSSLDAIFIMDREKFIDCNKAAEKLFECSKKEIIGKTPIDFSPEEQLNGKISKEFALKKIKNALNGKPQKFEWIHKTPAGKEKICEVSLNRFKIENNFFLTATVRDKTEKYQLEKEIKKQRDLLKRVIDFSPAIVYIVDPKDFSLKWFSENMGKYLGYSPREIGNGKKWWYKNVYPEDLKREDIKLKKIFKQKELVREYRFYKKDGTLIWVRDQMKLVIDNKNKTKEIIGAWIDITDSKRKEVEIEERNKLLNAINDNTNEGIIVLNNEGKIVFWNNAATKIFKYTKKEVINKDPHKILASEAVNTFLAGGKNFFTTGKLSKPKLIYNHAAIRKDGKKVQVEILLTQFTLADSPYVLTIVRDLSERVKMQKKIELEQKKFELTVKAINDAIITVDKKGRITLLNPEAEKLLNTTLQEALNKKLSNFLKIEEKNNKKLTCALILKKVLQSKKEFADKNKVFQIKDRENEKKLSIAISPIKDNEETLGAVIVIRDITERIKYQQELAKISKLEAINTLAGGIAHDFNNMLTSLYGYLDLARKTTVDPRVKEYLEKSMNTSKRASALANRLVSLSKTHEPKKEVQDITDSIKETVEFCLSGSKVSVDFQIQENLPPVNVDRAQIEEVIENITINAIQAMNNKGKLTISAKKVTLNDREIGTLPEGTYLKISIKDTGPGIPEEYLEKIFEPFFTTKPNGNGLGLASCFSIIKKHDGWIDVETEVGKGTTFHIYLPVTKKKTRKNPEKRQTEKQEKTVKEEKGFILIMDDEEQIRQVFREFLNILGYQTVETSNGEEAINFYKKMVLTGKKKIKGIILDLIVKGGMGGKEACKEIRKIDMNIPIIVISGSSSHPAIANPEKFGFNAALAKPVSFDDFSKVVNKVFG